MCLLVDGTPDELGNLHVRCEVGEKVEITSKLYLSLLQICRDVAGYTYGRADVVRRAMAKKQHKVMNEERFSFVEGAVSRGVDEKTANEIFDEMVSFASYGFNKAHSAAYAYVSYQTAYLKCHYPKQFYAALMSCCSSDKINEYIDVCSRLGIKIIPPHVNFSDNKFKTTDDGIVFSLSSIKNIGYSFISRIVNERELNGYFISFYDFCSRMYGKDFNRRAIESLIKCGALDNLDANRHQMIQSLDMVISDLDNKRRQNIEGQLSFGDLLSNESKSDSSIELPDLPEYSYEELLREEKEVSGIYLSGHPMKKYNDYYDAFNCDYISDILSDDEKYKDKTKVIILGIITDVRKKTTKNNGNMAFAVLEDKTNSVTTIIFPKVYDNYNYLVVKGSIVLIHGTVSFQDDSEPEIIIDSIEPLPKSLPEKKPNNKSEKSKAKGLFLRFDTENSPQVKICKNLVSIFDDGQAQCYLYFCDTKKYVKFSICDVNDVLLRELIKILGKDNVIFNS